MAGIRKSRVDKLWKRLAARRIDAAKHTATFYYNKVVTSSGADIDTFLGEYIDGRNPTNSDTLTSSGVSTLTVSGQAYTGMSGGGRSISEKDTLDFSPLGNFQPGDVIFATLSSRVSDSDLRNVKYITLSSHPNKKFRLVGSHDIGLVNVYTTTLLLRNTNAND